MHPTLQRLLAGRPVVTDGAWGTMLQSFGLETGTSPDLWNLAHPDRVEAVARAYADAGSAVILTNTFRSNRIALDAHGMSDRAAALTAAGVRASRTGAGGRAKVFASIGPTGKLPSAGEMTRDRLMAVFREQADAMAAEGADAIVIETMSDLEEALAALAAARTTGLPVVVSMVFDSGRNKDRTMTGVTIEEAARSLTDSGADVIGANCGNGIDQYIPVCTRLVASTSLPVWIKPNAGLPIMEEGTPVYRSLPTDFAIGARALRDAGASFIGGCCGTTPAHIHAVVKALAGASPRTQPS